MASAAALTGAPRTQATATVTHRQPHGQSSASFDRETRPVIKQPQQAGQQQQQARRQSPHRPPRVDPRSHACGTVMRLGAAGRHRVRAKTRRLSPAQSLAHGPALECHGDYTLTGPARLVKRGNQLLAFLESGGSASLWYHSEAIQVNDHDLRRSASTTSPPRRPSTHVSNAGNNVVPAAALNSARSPVAAPSPVPQTPCVLAGRLMELHGDVELAFSQGVILRPDKVVLNTHAIPDGATIQLPAGACIMHPLIL